MMQPTVISYEVIGLVDMVLLAVSDFCFLKMSACVGVWGVWVVVCVCVFHIFTLG